MLVQLDLQRSLLVSPAAHNSSVEVPAGDPLILDLFTFHPVTLTFSRTDGGSVTPVQMCTVDGRYVLCNAEYEDRVSVCGNSMVLRDVVSADSGVYTVREVKDGAALIRTVSVTVKGKYVINNFSLIFHDSVVPVEKCTLS